MLGQPRPGIVSPTGELHGAFGARGEALGIPPVFRHPDLPQESSPSK